MKYTILNYNKQLDYYELLSNDENGKRRIYVDLHVCGDFDINHPSRSNREYLVGKVVEIESMQPYLFLANDIREVE